MVFADRRDAGRKLAQKLLHFKEKKPLILGIPRGGTIVAAEVAAALQAPLDVVVPRKIGLPFNEEMAVGAVAQDGTVIYDEKALQYFGIDRERLSGQIAAALQEIKRRLELYRGTRKPLDCSGKVVILIDDGVATGYTAQAALRSLSKQKPRQLLFCVPVIAKDAFLRLRFEVDELAALVITEKFSAVGQFYESFEQNSDQEVIFALAHNNFSNDSK